MLFLQRWTQHDGQTPTNPRSEDQLGLCILPRIGKLDPLAFMRTMRLSTSTTGTEEMITIEKHDSRLMLVRYASPSDPSVEILAEFVSREAAEMFKSEMARAMLMSREVGRSGLG